MANVVIPENPEFNEALRIIETKDLVHADVVNPMFRTLLLNTIYLERRVAKMIERIDTLAIDNTYGGPELSADANIVDASAQFSVIRKTSSTASVQTLFQKAIDSLRKGLYLACKYCYQTHKGKKKMSFDTAKKMIDLLLTGEKGMRDYINPRRSPGLIIDFIGGEPLLEVGLIDRICSYTIGQMIELNHPWLMKTMFSICSNGVCYFEPEVQKVLQKWNNRLSFSVTVDGNKELHDSCRVFPDGHPSYDLAIAAAKDWMNKGGYMGSKVTIAPANVMHTYDAITHMIELGYNEINANCVYEEGWKPVHATVFYDQLKKLADYILEHNLDMEKDYYISLFEEKYFRPKQEDDLENWCGGNGVMLAVDPDGIIYPYPVYLMISEGQRNDINYAIPLLDQIEINGSN